MARSPEKKFCIKCKENQAVVVARQRDPLCRECAYTTALSKVRQAMRLKMGIVAEDKIMVCLSGGFSSRALLQLLQDCRSVDKNYPGRSKIAFDLVVAHVDQGAACGLDQAEADGLCERVRDSVDATVPPEDYTCLHLEDVYNAEGESGLSREQRRQKLSALIQSVPDSTGREDLVKALREALLLSEARRQGATRLARGDSISRLAARVIACSAKGAGFALPASLHYLDARFGPGQPMWISPVRELAAKDLAMIVHLRRLRTVALPPIPPAGRQESLNGLAERFIAGLQLGMPSTVHAVLGTACKLQAFDWNRQVQDGTVQNTDLCSICSSPLETKHAKVGSQMELACRICQQQLWGVSSSGSNATHAEAFEIPSLFAELAVHDFTSGIQPNDSGLALPRTTEWMEAQLNDCLL